MRKTKRIAVSLLAGACVLTAAAGVAACGGEEDILNVQSGTSTTLITDKAPDELSAENAIYAFLQKQSELQSYKITARGTAIADFMGYKQEILNITYKNGEDYLNQAQSDSALVRMKHQSFSKGGKVVYRDSFDGEMSVTDKDTYKQTYGFTADDVTLGGYIINAKTLRYATLDKADGDTLTYYMRLAGDTSLESGSTTESSTAAIRVQAKAYGSLDDLPTFSDIDIHLTFKKDWTPVSYTSACSYDCKKMFDMNVSQTLTCTYSEVNQNVEIPDVVRFNEMLGSTPSEVHPESGKEDPLMQIAAAFTNTLDENSALSLPVSLGLNISGAQKTVEGDLALKLRRETLEKGDLSDAFSLRLDLGLSEIPLLSAAANTLTVRVADGMLLLMLNNRENGRDNFLFTYAASLEGVADPSDPLTLDKLREDIAALVGIEKTDAGYTLIFKNEAIGQLNKAYQGLIGLLEEKIGDPQGYISSILGTTFTAAKLDLALSGAEGAQTLSGIALNVTGTPAENATFGEKLDVSIDTKLLGGNIAEPLTGELQFRLEPAAIWSGEPLKAIKAALHLDLSPAAGLFGTLQSLHIEQIPAFIPDSRSLDVYYTGDGTLTLAFNDENGLLIGVIDADLSGLSEKLPSGDGNEFPFTVDLCENGVGLILKESAVERLAEAYTGLVENLIEQATAALDSFTAGVAVGTLRGYLGANITGLQLALGKENGKLKLDLAVRGVLQNSETECRVLGVTLTHREALTAAERDALVSDEAANAAHEKLVKPTAYVEELQALIDYIDVTEGGKDAYAAEVNALKARIDAEPDEVKALISNRSYLEEKALFGQTDPLPLLLLLQNAYLSQVNSFKSKMPSDDNYTNFSESQWTSLNSVFDKGSAIMLSDFTSVATPAVKDCKAMLDAIGQAHIDAYTAARDAWEDATARAFLEELNGLTTELANKTTTEDLQGLLTAFKNVQAKYQKIAEGKRAIVNDAYDAYVLAIGQKNFEAIEKEYAELQSAIDASDGETMETLIPLLVRFNDVAKWHTGWDYWNSTAKAVSWGSALETSGFLAQLIKEDSKAAVEASINAAKKLRAETAGKIVEKFSGMLKGELTALKAQTDPFKQVTGSKTTYDFSSIGSDADALNDMLAKMQALRFLFTNTTLSDEAKAAFFGEEADLQTFATTDLKNCEKTLAAYIKTLPSA